MIIQIFEFIATFIEIFTGIMVCEVILSEKRADWKNMLTAACLITAMTWCLNHIEIFSPILTVMAVVSISLSIYLYKKIPVWDTMIICSLYMVLLYIVDFLTLSIAGIMLKEERMAQIIAGSFSYTRICVMMCSKLILASISYLLTKYVLMEVSLPVRKIWIGIILAIVAIYCLIYETFIKVNSDITWSWFFLLALFIISLYSVVQYIKHLQERRKWELLQGQYQRDIDRYDSMIKIYEMNQRFYHDMKNQYLILNQLLDQDEYDKAKEYLHKLDSDKPVSAFKHWTGIYAVDILLNCKIEEAESLGIRIDTEIGVIQTRLSEQEMTILLGNALDNAIDACKKVPDNKKSIHIEVRRQYEMTFIRISNAIAPHAEVRIGNFATSKENKIVHGHGLNSMKMIVDKYAGTLKSDVQGSRFCLSISFFD